MRRIVWICLFGQRESAPWREQDWTVSHVIAKLEDVFTGIWDPGVMNAL